jgi:putative spermidine/putrescine transport system permease protein
VTNELRASLRRTGPATMICGCLVAVFLLVPLAVILPIAFSADTFLVFPPTRLSTRWFTEVFADPDWRASVLLSTQVAAGATALAAVAGTSAAFALRRARRGQRLLRTAMIAPLVIPQLVLALGLYLAVDDLGGKAGIKTLVLGQAVLAAPIVYLTVSAGLTTVDPALSRAARGLGHRWPSVLLRIELPLVARSVAGSAVLAFGLCFDESVLAYYLSPPGRETLPTRIWLSASQSASPAIAVVSSLVIGLAIVLLGLSLALRRRKL